MNTVSVRIFLIILWTNSSFVSTIDISCVYIPKMHNLTTIKVLKQFECSVAGKFEVKERGLVVESIKDINLNGSYRPKTHEDIYGIKFASKLIKFMPRGIQQFIPKLISLAVIHCQLEEINQDDLKEYIHLQFLDVSTNDIVVIGKDLFKFNPNLQAVNFNSNNIKTIDGNVFDNLKFLKLLLLAANSCINRSGQDIQAIIETIKKDCSGAAYETQNNDKKNTKKIKIDVSHGTKYWIFVGFGVVACVIVGGGLVMLVYRIIKPRAI